MASSTKQKSKKLVQPQLSNFFLNSKVHISSDVNPKDCVSVEPTNKEDEENAPFHSETLASLGAEKSKADSSKTPSVKNFMKVPYTHVSTQSSVTKKRKLSAESSIIQSISKAVKTPKITGSVECDPEVSSSSEAVENVSPPNTNPKKGDATLLASPTPRSTPNKCLTLDRFLQTTQQAEVSTTASNEVDTNLAKDKKDNSVVEPEESKTESEVAPEVAKEEEPSATEDATPMEVDPQDETINLKKPAPPGTPKTVTMSKVLTPKQRAHQEKLKKLRQEKEAEKEKLKQEKQKEKEEKLKAKQMEKEKIEKDKEELRKKREEEKKRKSEEQEAEKLKKEEERKVKEEDRNEEKRKKEEEKQRKEEEKKLLHEKQQKEEQEQVVNKEKQAKVFANFFTKKEKTTETDTDVEETTFGIPFQVREHMVLAPIRRRSPSDVQLEHLDGALSLSTEATLPSPSNLYLRKLEEYPESKKRNKGTKTLLPGTKDNTAPPAWKALRNFDPKDDANITVACKAKFLHFHENNRPAYFGTFRKLSKTISPRNPLAKDEDFFDYEVDSDDEWEEEEPGEDLEKQSDGEGEEEEGVEETEEDPFFVPHGYLSDGEGAESAGESENDDEDEESDDEEKKEKKAKMEKKSEAKIPESKLDPATRKAQQEVKAKAFEVERKARKITRLIPRCVGILLASLPEAAMVKRDDVYEKEKARALNIGAAEMNHLAAFRAVTISIAIDTPIPTNWSHPKKPKTSVPGAKTMNVKGGEESGSTPGNTGKIQPVPDEAIPDLLRLVHGSTVGLPRMIQEFKLFWKQKTATTAPPDADSPQVLDTAQMNKTPSKGGGGVDISKRQLEITIKSVAEYKDNMWMVSENVQKKYDLFEKLPVPHQWQFITKRPKRPGRPSKEIITPVDSNKMASSKKPGRLSKEMITPVDSIKTAISKMPVRLPKEIVTPVDLTKTAVQESIASPAPNTKTPQRTLFQFFNKSALASPSALPQPPLATVSIEPLAVPILDSSKDETLGDSENENNLPLAEIVDNSNNVEVIILDSSKEETPGDGENENSLSLSEIVDNLNNVEVIILDSSKEETSGDGEIENNLPVAEIITNSKNVEVDAKVNEAVSEMCQTVSDME